MLGDIPFEPSRGAGVYAGWFEGLRRPFDVRSTSFRRPSEVQLPLSGARLLLRCAPARRKRCSGTENTLMHLERAPECHLGHVAGPWQPSDPRCLPRMRCLQPSLVRPASV